MQTQTHGRSGGHTPTNSPKGKRTGKGRRTHGKKGVTARKSTSMRARQPNQTHLAQKAKALMEVNDQRCFTLLGTNAAVTFTGRSLDQKAVATILGLTIANTIIEITPLTQNQLDLAKIDNTVDRFGGTSKMTPRELDLADARSVLTIRDIQMGGLPQSLCGIMTDIAIRVTEGHPEITEKPTREQVAKAMKTQLRSGLLTEIGWQELGIEGIVVYWTAKSTIIPTKQTFAMPWSTPTTTTGGGDGNGQGGPTGKLQAGGFLGRDDMRQPVGAGTGRG